MKLSELAIGEKGRIVRIGNVGDLKRRLRELGITRGEVVEVEHVAPLGDPVEIIVKNCRLSLRKEEAEHIEVEKL
ncbi:MAG: ferrous iron transport protein A [Deferribacteres bacterium]|nr:ferrous iron transport protein A [Deferribacteres bacterium]